MIGSVTATDLPCDRDQPPVVGRDDDGDEGPQEQDELALRDQIGLAGLVNQLGDLEHRCVDGQVLELCERHEAEQQAERADDETAHEQRVAVDTTENVTDDRSGTTRLASPPARRTAAGGRRLGGRGAVTRAATPPTPPPRQPTTHSPRSHSSHLTGRPDRMVLATLDCKPSSQVSPVGPPRHKGTGLYPEVPFAPVVTLRIPAPGRAAPSPRSGRSGCPLRR